MVKMKEHACFRCPLSGKDEEFKRELKPGLELTCTSTQKFNLATLLEHLIHCIRSK